MKLTLYKQMFLVKYSKQLQKILSNSLKNTGVNNSEIVSTTIPAKLINVLFFLKNSTYSQFTLLTDIVAYDRPGCSERFTLIYCLLSVKYNTRLFLTLSVDELESVPSVNTLYPSGNWMEREVWDLFGIFFSDHPDLRRILTDYGFEGHPLRKDFPLSGYVEVLYDTNKKKIAYESIELAQEYRDFRFNSP